MTSEASAPHTTPEHVMRGVAGGVLLGIPLLYTQEVWDHGRTMEPQLILAMLALAVGINAALSYYVGFTPGRTHRPFEDAVVGFGISIILAAGLLFLFGRVVPGMSVESAAGIIALTSIPIGIGFSIGNALAPREGGEGSDRMTGDAGDLLAAAGGAIVLALNIAPTEEPVRLSQELGWVRLVLLVAMSLIIPYLIVFYAEFGGKDRRRAGDGATQGPLTETLLAYLVAFILSAGLLWAFGRFGSAVHSSLAQTVVLAFPAALGAALGRMLV